MADIAIVTSMTKTPALSAQSDATSAANAPDGSGAPFEALLQLVAQHSTPANDTSLPVAPNDNSSNQTSDDSTAQTTQQVSQQSPQDFSSLIALMQSLTPRQPLGKDASALPMQAEDDAGQAASTANQTANNARIISVQAQQNPMASSQAQGESVASAADQTSTATSDTTPAAVTAAINNALTQSTPPQTEDSATTDAADVLAAQPATPTVADKGAKPAGKSDRKTADSTGPVSDAKTAADANSLAALAQQIQILAGAPQSSTGNTMTAGATDTQAITSVTSGKQQAAGVAISSRQDTASNALTNGDVKTAAAGNNSGNILQTAANATSDLLKETAGRTGGSAGSKDDAADAADADVSKSNATANSKNTTPLPSPIGSHNVDQIAGQTSQSSVSVVTSHAQASVTSTVSQLQTDPTNAASVNVNLQVAAKHPDTSSTATLDTLGTTIAANSSNGVKHFDIRMEPPELGRVEVRLSVDASGNAQANLVVDKPQTLELLRRDASDLTRSLNDAGVSLSNNGLNFSLRGQDRQNDGGSVAKGRSRALSVQAVMSTDAISNSSSIYSLAPDSVRLDIRV